MKTIKWLFICTLICTSGILCAISYPTFNDRTAYQYGKLREVTFSGYVNGKNFIEVKKEVGYTIKATFECTQSTNVYVLNDKAHMYMILLGTPIPIAKCTISRIISPIKKGEIYECCFTFSIPKEFPTYDLELEFLLYTPNNERILDFSVPASIL